MSVISLQHTLCSIMLFVFLYDTLLSFLLMVMPQAISSILYAKILALKTTKSVINFLQSSSFFYHAYHASFITFFSLLLVVCYHALNIWLYQILFLHFLQCLCKNFLSLSYTQSCLCPYRISLPHF